MSNEAVIIEKYGRNGDGGAVRRTIASNAAVSYGTLLALTDENTVALPTVVVQAFGGIAAMEKKNNDYSTDITVYTDVVADLKASQAIAIGAAVTFGSTFGGNNYVSEATAGGIANGVSVANIIGVTQGIASDNEVIRVRITPRS